MNTNEHRDHETLTKVSGSERLLLTIPEAAARLGIGRSTVYELTAAGELEVVHIGRCARIPAAALDDFVRRIRDQR